MPFSSARALGVVAMLASPAGAFAQTSRPTTVFSPSSQMGTVAVRAALVLPDYSVKPLPLLRVVARRTDRPDSVSGQTDLDGRLTIPLRVGTYTLQAKAPNAVPGRSYAWAVRIVVRPTRTELVQLTNANASADSTIAVPTVVASAPAVSTAPAPAPVKGSAVTEKATVVEKAAVAQKVAGAEKPVSDPFLIPATVAAPAPARATVAAPAPAPRRTTQPMLPRVNTSKLILGLSLNGSSIRSEELTTSAESGAGLEGQLGWGFTRNFAIVVDASAARIESLGGNVDRKSGV